MIHTKGKFIVLEGGDGSGKATQARLLTKALQEYSPTAFYEFPRYKQSAFGALIGRCLAGEFGNFLELSPYLSSLPYMLDRTRAKYLLIESLKDGHVICDRYTPSNIAYQAAKIPKGKERQTFINFIEEGEYGELGLPEPDMVIYLQVPADISAELIKKKQERNYLAGTGRTHDQFEENIKYQQEVMGVYLDLAKQRKSWHIINCLDKNKKLLPREDIHLQVIKLVKKELKLE